MKIQKLVFCEICGREWVVHLSREKYNEEAKKAVYRYCFRCKQEKKNKSNDSLFKFMRENES